MGVRRDRDPLLPLLAALGYRYSRGECVLPDMPSVDGRCVVIDWHDLITQALSEREALARPWTLSHAKLVREPRYWYKTFDLLDRAPAGRIGTIRVWHDPDRACCERESWARTLYDLLWPFDNEKRANIESVAREHGREHFANANSIFQSGA